MIRLLPPAPRPPRQRPGESTSGAQLLYQAIGAANLRAFIDGQDDVGHAAISN
jgi:hypothetical protein